MIASFFLLGVLSGVSGPSLSPLEAEQLAAGAFEELVSAESPSTSSVASAYACLMLFSHHRNGRHYLDEAQDQINKTPNGNDRLCLEAFFLGLTNDPTLALQAVERNETEFGKVVASHLYLEVAGRMRLEMWANHTMSEDTLQVWRTRAYTVLEHSDRPLAERDGFVLDTLGRAYFAAREYDRARGVYEILANRYPHRPTLRFALGNVCSKGGDYGAAITALESYLEDGPNRVSAYFILSDCYSHLGDASRAEEFKQLGKALLAKDR